MNSKKNEKRTKGFKFGLALAGITTFIAIVLMSTAAVIRIMPSTIPSTTAETKIVRETTTDETTLAQKETTAQITAKAVETTATETTTAATTVITTAATTAAEITSVPILVDGVEIVSLSSPIKQGTYATISIVTVPGSFCHITVYYNSREIKADGLESKTADKTGNCSGTWKVENWVSPGDWPIVIKVDGVGETKVSFTVIEK